MSLSVSSVLEARQQLLDQSLKRPLKVEGIFAPLGDFTNLKGPFMCKYTKNIELGNKKSDQAYLSVLSILKKECLSNNQCLLYDMSEDYNLARVCYCFDMQYVSELNICEVKFRWLKVDLMDRTCQVLPDTWECYCEILENVTLIPVEIQRGDYHFNTTIPLRIFDSRLELQYPVIDDNYFRYFYDGILDPKGPHFTVHNAVEKYSFN